MNGFITKVDFSDNRQIKQYPKTSTELSGSTDFGITFSALTSGPDLTTSGVTEEVTGVTSTFSGNTGTTIISFGDSDMELGVDQLDVITSANSADTQYVLATTATSTTTIDGNTVNLEYSGVEYTFIVTAITETGTNTWSGETNTPSLIKFTADTLDYTGRTIWNDVHGITRTEKLIITNNPQVGYVLTCYNSEGMANWQPSSGSSATLWSAGTGSNSVALLNADSIASGDYAVSEGLTTVASGYASHAEGKSTIASGTFSHAEGGETTADGVSSHAEGGQTKAIANYSHSQGQYTIAGNRGSHSGGMGYGPTNQVIASGVSSFNHSTTEDGFSSSASGDYSAILGGKNNNVAGEGSIILGGNGISGTSDYTTYVEDLVAKNDIYISGLTSQDPIATDADGKIVGGTSDERLKTNIQNIAKSAISKLSNLRSVSFEYTPESNMGTGFTKYGFIAQEVQDIIPEIVREIPNSDYLNLSYIELIPWIVKAIQEMLEGIIIPNYTPSGTTDVGGVTGELAWDDDYIYMKTDNGWRRTKLETF